MFDPNRLPGYDEWKLQTPYDDEDEREVEDDDGDYAYDAWRDREIDEVE